RPDAICCSLLVPIPGTEVYEEIKSQLVSDVTEQDFHFWHHSEFWKHPRFSHDELVAERERLIKRHASAVYTTMARLHRKWERLLITLRHPVLLLDFLEILRRHRAFKQRSRASSVGQRRQNWARLQIPTFMKH